MCGCADRNDAIAHVCKDILSVTEDTHPVPYCVQLGSYEVRTSKDEQPVVTSHLARSPWNSNANESLLLLRDRGSWVRRVATQLMTLVLGNCREVTKESDWGPT